MTMHVRTEGDKIVFSSAYLRLLLTLFESRPHIIIIFHLKTNRQKLEKYHVSGSQTRIYFKVSKIFFVNNKKKEKHSKMMLNIFLRKQPSHHGELP